MKKLLGLIVLTLAGFVTPLRANPNPTVDCSCLANIPALHTTCPGIVPDLSVWATNCFSTNVNPGQMGFFNQIPPAGAWLPLGTNSIMISVQDTNYNTTQCFVDFVVTVPPATNLTLICASNKTVECGSAWQFEEPFVYTTCCETGLTVITLSTVTNGICPKVITRTWQANDACGNTNVCTQTITVADTMPPVTFCSGANLVPNPGFESVAYCPSNVYQPGPPFPAFPWFSATASTPDAFNACDPTGTNVCVPTNFFGFQNAYSGQAYGGAYVYGPIGFNTPNSPYREYLETPLIVPLIAGQTYKVSFRVNLSDVSGRAIAEIGAYFSAGPTTDPGNGIIPVVPQVVNPAGNILNSTSVWALIQGTFVATGGEDHMTVGNFLTDANTTSIPMPSLPQYANFGYYYYDDFSVTAVCGPQATNKTVLCGAPIIFDQPTGFDFCSGTNVNVTVANTVTNGICPQIITRNWTLTDACGNSNSWSQTVTVIDTNPPVIFCPTNNLVPNGNFESYTNCPNNLSQTEYAAPWFTPTLGTSDYFNSCAGPGNFASVPTNLRGSQTAHSGQGYAGGEVYSVSGTNAIKSYREYIEAPLISPLVAGQAYQVSFWVSLADNSGWAIAEVGAHFSVGPLTNYGISSLLTVTPQVVNPSYNVLTSTSSWTLVQGIFTAAGGEDHITIGSFLADVNLTAVIIPGGSPSVCEYYYDDILVVPVCGELAMNKNVSCGAPWTFNPPTGYDACSGTNVAVTVVNTTTNPCSTFFTRTWSLTDLCGNSTNWTQTVTVSDPSPLSINCFCLSELAANLLYTNGCPGIVPNLLQFTNCFSTNCRPVVRTQSPVAGTIVGPGVHPITVSVTDCVGNSNGCSIPFQVNGLAPIIKCPKDITLFTCDAYAIGWYAPMIGGNVGSIVLSPPSGSLFPLNTSTLVTCTASNECGGSTTCTFAVTVLRPPGRWSCLTIVVIGVPVSPVGTAIATYLPVLPGGGLGVNLDNLASSGQNGAQFDLGAAQKFTFSTVLDFNATEGASFSLNLTNSSGGPGTSLLTFKKACQPSCSWQIKADKDIVSDTSAKFSSIAIGDNGDLFSSFAHDAVSFDTNTLVSLSPANGATSAVVTVTLDCLTRELTLAIPQCDWMPDASGKGWNGRIRADVLRGGTTNQTARVILKSTTPEVTAPITSVTLLTSNLTSLAFDNPSITAAGHDWSAGAVSLMKGYDDGTNQGVEFAAFGGSDQVTTDLGNAASFSFRMKYFETGDVPTQEQFFTIRGWPPGTTTNRPPSPPIQLRLTHNTNSTGIECAVDYTGFGISNVTLQLWNGPVLVTEKVHVPAAVASAMVTLSDFPTIFNCPGNGLLTLASTNLFTVLSGLDCPTTGCIGDQLRILSEFDSTHLPPAAFGELTCAISAGMDDLLYDLQSTPACLPVPLNVVQGSSGVTISWAADGFHLMGAENANGPWYDLGVKSPVTLDANHPARYFRLSCD